MTTPLYKRKDLEYHPFLQVSPQAEKKLEELLNFLDSKDLAFYDMDEKRSWDSPKMSEKSIGNQRYVYITISIKLS